MNSRGVFLTLMVFFVGIVVVALAISGASLQKERESLIPLNTARNLVNEQFDQSYYDIENLLSNPKRTPAQSRNLLFSYSIGSDNSILLKQALPIPREKFDQFNDFLNRYAIFSSYWDQNSSAATTYSFQSLKNFFWGGNTRWPDYNYKILPQCVVYVLDYKNHNSGDNRIMEIRKGIPEMDGCAFDREPDCPTKNFYRIQKIEVKIYGTELSTLYCTGELDNGEGGCKQEIFDNEQYPEFPFVEVKFFVSGNEENPPTASAHIDPSDESAVWFQFNGAEPTTNNSVSFASTTDIAKIDLSSNLPALQTRAEVTIQFRKPMDAIVLEGFSTTVEQPGFSIRRISEPEIQETYCGDFFCDATESNQQGNPNYCADCDNWGYACGSPP